MYFAFMDDSSRKRKDVPRDGLGALHAYGAVIFSQESLQPYREQLARLRQELNVPAGTEFKWSPDGGLFTRSGPICIPLGCGCWKQPSSLKCGLASSYAHLS
jgi:hypothetical protein